jgi:hypothetical protein
MREQIYRPADYRFVNRFRAVEIHRLFLIRVRKKKTRVSRRSDLIIMGLQLNHHSDEGH